MRFALLGTSQMPVRYDGAMVAVAGGGSDDGGVDCGVCSVEIFNLSKSQIENSIPNDPMAEVLADNIDDDVMEQILIRLDAKDLIIRCKRVCKSWNSIINTRRFAESYLIKRNENDDPQVTKRIYMGSTSFPLLIKNKSFVAGCANGLVCVSPKEFRLVVTNPFTRRFLKILEPTPEPLPKTHRRWDLVWGFGYDSSNSDYKIVVGYMEANKPPSYAKRFYVFSLKTCRWKFVGEYQFPPTINSVSGILCDGALHWAYELLSDR
uniref:putative F-box protein At3g16210 n=1 Tax=Erigeron canadensis TaxID=72917 RepID=UPI001CB9790B|nr:putative F-box protein At3g16210 [Erigeron canadensis]